MAQKRVVAYYMHEAEQVRADQLIPNAEKTDSFLVGMADDATVEQLRAEGFVVQATVSDKPRDLNLKLPPALAGQHFRAARRGAIPLTPLGAEFVAPTPDFSRPQQFLLWIEGPLLESMKAQLRARGVELSEAFPGGVYKARLIPATVAAVAALPFVTEVRLFDAADTAPELAATQRAVLPGAPVPVNGIRVLLFEVRLHRAEDLPVVRGWLEGRHLAIVGASRRKLRVALPENHPALAEIPGLPEVAAFEEFVPPRLHNDRGRHLLGVDTGHPFPALPQTGAGQIVAVADTGLDDAHADFTGQIAGIVARGRPGNHSDPHGHGTHVAGSVLGTGAASGGTLRGVAPGAKLFFQSLLDPTGGLGGLPVDLNDLFDEAYLGGARIHNNSWGAATASRYTVNSSEVDEFVADHRDMLIVISAGNEGTAAAPRTNAAAGFVDWLSIGSPASCKNALTVGASRSDRTSGGLSTLTYGTAWPASFPDAPIAQETVSGNPECLAAFSSRGPCDDRRIKPDLVAPGTDIASARSSVAPLSHFHGPYPGNASYAFMGGTSMSAPLVSGCAALVREFYVRARDHEPSAALLKATLVNGTVRLTGADAVAPAPGEPNFHQGFGRVSMLDTLPNSDRPNQVLAFVDDWRTPAKGFTQTGERRRFLFTLAAPSPELRICLAYTDLPARALQNNLNLLVEPPGGGRKLVGNAQLPHSLNIPDPDNNVESVRLTAAPAGTYLIQVMAGNLLKGPQDFALVVVAENLSPLTPI